MERNRPSRKRWIAYLAVAALAITLGLAFFGTPAMRTAHEVGAAGADRTHPEQGAAVIVPMPARVESLLSGTIRAAGGKAIEGATVCAHCAACNLLLTDTSPACVRSDRDGKYGIGALTAGEYLVSASATGYAPKGANGGNPIVFPGRDGSSTSNLDITLDEGGAMVTGVVLDVTGGPVAGAAVQTITGLVVTDGRPTTRTVIADEDGRFEVSCLPGRVTLMATADGYAPGFANRTAPSSDVQVIVSPSSSMSGTVVTAEGRPVANIRVSAEAPTDSLREAVTDQAGRFAISGLRHGVFEVRAMGDGWLGDYPATVTLGVADTARDVTIVVYKAVSVRGTLLSEDGKPCDYGRVHMGPRPGDFTAPVLDATTTADGAVTLQGVLPGTYYVSVSCGAPEFQPASVLQVGTDELSGLVWQVKAQLAISGRVLDERGQPVGKFLFELLSKEGSRGVAALADGSFSWSGLTPGDYTLQSPHFVEPVTVRLAWESVKDVKVIAKVLGRIAVRVTTPSGEPVEKLTVTATATDGTVTDLPEEMGNGTYVLGPLAVGSYKVNVGDDVNPRVEASGVVRGGETTQLAVTYGGYQGRIAGRVIDDRGAPIENVWVQALPSAAQQGMLAEMRQNTIEAEMRRSLTDAEGRFELSGLEERATFVVRAEWPLGGNAKVEGVRPGANVDVVMESLGSLSGIAVDPAGQPAQHFNIQLTNAKTGQQRTELMFAPDGKWHMDGVTPGPLQVLVADSNRNIAMLTWTLAPKQKLGDLRVELKPGAPAAPPAGGPEAQPGSSEAPRGTVAENM